MNFFQHQEAARKKTGLLIVYFALAVVSIIVATYAVVGAILAYGQSRVGSFQPDAVLLWDPGLFLSVAGIVMLIVAVGSAYKMLQLSKGGAAVARLLGGRQIDPAATDPDERRLLNVVEEMSIASGVPVPAVFVMDDEQGVNAFAAGITPQNAVICLTAGCMQLLTRDELQGVVAHEFSHILNADMKMNLRIMGILNGILVLAILGYYMMRIFGSGRSSRSSSGKAKGGGAALAIIGLAVMIIGYIGVFFGNLIKAAVSRQREFLADASAVQFTRNPAGIGGALKKIGGLTVGSRIRSHHAAEASHFFFASGVTSWVSGLFATHPPLAERIRRIDPAFDGELPSVDETRARSLVRQEEALAPVPAFVNSPAGFSADAGRIVASVGMLTPGAVASAATLVSGIAPELLAACREPRGARAIVYCLLLSADESVRRAQTDLLREHADVPILADLERLGGPIARAGESCRLPLVDLASPALKRLSADEYREFRGNIDLLIDVAGAETLFEYALHLIVVHRLDPLFSGEGPVPVRYRTVEQLMAETTVLFSALVHAGPREDEVVQRAFEGAWAALGIAAPSLLPLRACGVDAVDRALKAIGRAAYPVKERIIAAMAAMAATGGSITTGEAELLRAVAIFLDCPIPPIVLGRD
jgi:Zn-dependent protease with chaperone function